MDPQIVHEAEVHRQHVRLRIPIEVEIDETRYSVDDWSMGGIGVQKDISTRQPGERFTARLIFPFEDFEIHLQLDCQMVYRLDDHSRFGCQFTSLSQGQISLFRYLIDAYLSGELVTGGDVLHILGRENTAEVRQNGLVSQDFAEERGKFYGITKFLGYITLCLAGIVLFGLIFFGLKERYFTIHADRAFIYAPSFDLRAPVSGIIEIPNLPTILRENSIIAQIRSETGQIVEIDSICNCVARNWTVENSTFVAQGEQVVTLVSADTPLEVRAKVEFERALRLNADGQATIIVPDGNTIKGTILRIDYREEEANDYATVVIKPQSPLDFELLGYRVSVRFP